VQGCHDLSLGWQRTDSVQYSQTGGGGGRGTGSVHRLDADVTATSAPCYASAADDCQTSSMPFHCSDAGERRDQYSIIDLTRGGGGGFSTRQPDAGLELDLVDGVLDRTVDGAGGRALRAPADRTPPLLANPPTTAPRPDKATMPPRRVNFDVAAESVRRPACSCGTLSGVDHSPYYFKLDDVTAPAVGAFTAPAVGASAAGSDRSPLIAAAGHPVTSHSRHADVTIGGQCREQL